MNDPLLGTCQKDHPFPYHNIGCYKCIPKGLFINVVQHLRVDSLEDRVAICQLPVTATLLELCGTPYKKYSFCNKSTISQQDWAHLQSYSWKCDYRSKKTTTKEQFTEARGSYKLNLFRKSNWHLTVALSMIQLCERIFIIYESKWVPKERLLTMTRRIYFRFFMISHNKKVD